MTPGVGGEIPCAAPQMAPAGDGGIRQRLHSLGYTAQLPTAAEPLASSLLGDLLAARGQAEEWQRRVQRQEQELRSAMCKVGGVLDLRAHGCIVLVPPQPMPPCCRWKP